MDDSYSLRDLIAADERQIPASVDILGAVSPQGPAAITTAWEAYRALIQRIDEGQSIVAKLTDDHSLAGMVASLCARMFRWGITDLLRGRTTSAFGYARQQAEAVALVHLFRVEPGAARQWYEINSDALGRQFHQTYNRKLMALLDQMDGMRETYEKGSGHALHVRIPSALRGYRAVSRESGLVEFILLDRDVSAEHLTGSCPRPTSFSAYRLA